jgi:hypothetical protein
VSISINNIVYYNIIYLASDGSVTGTCVGIRHCKIKTQICEDSFPQMIWICRSRYPWVFSRIYPWIPAIDPDSCSALVEADELQDAIREFAELLVKNNDFIYKGMETARVSPTLLHF